MVIATLTEVSVSARGRRLLGPVSLALSEGEFVGVVGPNGAGKSTLLGLLAGMIPPSSGMVTVFGTEARGCSPCFPVETRARIGYLLQRHESTVDLPFRVSDVVRFGAAGCGESRSRAADSERLEAALYRAGLQGFGARLFRELSGGEQQKVHLARLWYRGASLVLLDEPTAGLDPDQRERLTAAVAELHADGGRTVVMVTHDLATLPVGCDRLLLLKDGRPLAAGSAPEVATAESLSVLYDCRMQVVAQGGRYHAFSTGPTEAGS